jgi:N-carbamoylputrescine amidase
MRKVTVAATQMACSWDVDDNIKKAEKLVISAAKEGANIVVLQELFETPYFPQQEGFNFYNYASSVEENKAVNHFQLLCRELGVVVPVSFFEKSNQVYFNTVAMIDADGTILGTYRKSHIPADPQYEEKLYLTPGNTGFRVWDTRFGKLGVGICWDQWFMECARIMGILGAELILYPTCTGFDKTIINSSKAAWRNVMKGHAASNLIPVVTSNRIGTETIEGMTGSSTLTFFGSSFITDERGVIIAEADENTEGFITATFDLDMINNKRASYGMFRDRRIDLYADLVKDTGSRGGMICEK